MRSGISFPVILDGAVPEAGGQGLIAVPCCRLHSQRFKFIEGIVYATRFTRGGDRGRN